MDVVRLLVFVCVVRGALLWASVAIVARRQPRNRFASMLLWSAVIVAVQQLGYFVFGTSAIVAILWCSALLAILVAYYRLGPLRALAALVLVVASWFGSMFVLAELLGRNHTAEYAVVTTVPLAILAVWIIAARRARRSETPRSA
jgi:hypothetical protein